MDELNMFLQRRHIRSGAYGSGDIPVSCALSLCPAIITVIIPLSNFAFLDSLCLLCHFPVAFVSFLLLLSLNSTFPLT